MRGVKIVKTANPGKNSTLPLLPRACEHGGHGSFTKCTLGRKSRQAACYENGGQTMMPLLQQTAIYFAINIGRITKPTKESRGDYQMLATVQGRQFHSGVK
ncbi:hypothetical protein Bbelb_136110 [Branchiostoma belcheri]|nr:hypothetical protein Bbelb_136110 [Branchiostoma belcheri]